MSANVRSDALRGNPYACLAMAYFHQTGKEMVQDMDLALEWYRRAADLGCARAHWELSQMYLYGGPVEPDDSLYITHLESAARLGNPDAQFTLGLERLTGRILLQDYDAAFKCMHAAASQGNSRAKFAVGYMIARGISVERSVPEAETWFSSAALTGDGDLFLDIGLAYEFGIDMIGQDLVEAARWYKYGVDMGHEKCIICWRMVLETLDGAPQESLESRLGRLDSTVSQTEIDEIDRIMAEGDALFEAEDGAGALECYQRAADLGSPDAMFTVAMIYHQGIEVRRDDAHAISILARAADAGSADAQFYLASAYENGIMPKDDSQIVKLYSDAAANGFLAAFYYLGQYVDRPEVYVRRTHTRG